MFHVYAVPRESLHGAVTGACDPRPPSLSSRCGAKALRRAAPARPARDPPGTVRGSPSWEPQRPPPVAQRIGRVFYILGPAFSFFLKMRFCHLRSPNAAKRVPKILRTCCSRTCCCGHSKAQCGYPCEIQMIRQALTGNIWQRHSV